MLIGSFPVADYVEGDDILIISKDGIHLQRITVREAGFGGGLRWWRETPDNIYNTKQLGDDTAASNGKPCEITGPFGEEGATATVDGLEWHDRYYLPEDAVLHASYPALDLDCNQPYVLVQGERQYLYTDVLLDDDDPDAMTATGVLSRQHTIISNMAELGPDGGICTQFHIPFSKAFPRVYIARGYLDTYFVTTDHYTQAEKATTQAVYNEIVSNWGRDVDRGTWEDLVASGDGGYLASVDISDPWTGMDHANLPYLFIVSCIGRNYDSDYPGSYIKIESDLIDPDDPTAYTDDQYVTNGTDSVLGEPRTVIDNFTDTKTGDTVTEDFGRPKTISVTVHGDGGDDALWNVVMIPINEALNPYLDEHDWRQLITINGEVVGDVPWYLGTVGKHPAYRPYAEVAEYVEQVADLDTYTSSGTDGASVKTVWRYKDEDKWRNYILQNARAIATKVVQGFKLHSYECTNTGADSQTIYTDIGVKEGDAFRTGIMNYYEGEDEPVLDVKAYIDPVRGAGYFSEIYEYNKGDFIPLRDYYQVKLIAGTNIDITYNDTGDEATISSSESVDLSNILDNKLVQGTGINITKDNVNGTYTFSMNHEIISATASSTRWPVNATRSYGTNAMVYDALYFDVDQYLIAALEIPVLSAGPGINVYKSGRSNTISSYAITDIRVDGVSLPQTIEPPTQQDPAQIVVDIDSSEWGGGGGPTYTVPSPVLAYEDREIITTFTEVNNTYTAPYDGVLFFENRQDSADVCVKVSIDNFEYCFGNYGSYTPRSDSSNMLPLQRGDTVTMTYRSGTISVSEYATNNNRFFFIPFERLARDSQSFPLPDFAYGQGSTSISSNDFLLDGASGEHYIFTPTVDGVLTTNGVNQSNENGIIYVQPLDGNDEPVGKYILHQKTSGQSSFPISQFPMKAGKKYMLTKTSVNQTADTFYYYTYKTSNSLDAHVAPYLDFANASDLTLQNGSDRTFIDIPSPSVTTRPGILINTAKQSWNGYTTSIVPIMVYYNKNGMSPFRLASKYGDMAYNYITVGAYNLGQSALTLQWQYYRDFSNFDPCKLTFIPFKNFLPPGVETVSENGNNLVLSGVADLSAIYDRVAALEAIVFPNP